MRHPDQKYIDALLSNDAPLLEEIYRNFSGKIKSMVLQNNGTDADAADIFQDALLSIYHKAKSGDFALTCPLDAFLYLICKNKWLNELAKKKSRGVTFPDPAGYPMVSEEGFRLAEECSLFQERNNLLVEKMSELGESCRRLLQLSWSGKSMNEVAEMLKVTYGYARKKKSECMGKLIESVRRSRRFNALKW
jgi:RNA polymerase sigma factor (sigma-70 family)